MTLHPRLPRAGVELVKRFEGLRRRAARLPDGRWTIGYGHTASAREGVEVSAEDAEALLLYDLSRVAHAVDDVVLSPLNENQFAAVVAFAFNVGVERFVRSEVLKRLNEGAYLQAAAAIELWRRSDFEGESIVVDALVRRRAAEKLLFLTPPEGFRPAPTPLVPPQHDREALGPAHELDMSLEGDTAKVRLLRPDAPPAPRSEPPTTAAARSVIERLNAILADAPIAPPPEPPPGREPPPAPTEEAVEPPPFPEARPEPPASIPPPELVADESAPTLEDAFEAAEEPREPSARPEPRVVEELGALDVEREPRGGFVVMVLGVFGLALFVAALATILFGRATWTNLALGLAGIVAMAPAAVMLLGGRKAGHDA